ncbi:MAG TPA: hypothetical protein VF797_04870 [Noviherbaspirillum sp.]
MDISMLKPPSLEIIEASARLATKIKRENTIYTMRLDLAHEYNLPADVTSTLFDQAMAKAGNDLYEARAVFRELVKAMQ